MTKQIRPNELIRILRPEFGALGSGGAGTAGADIDITGSVVSRSGNAILLFDSGGAILQEYEATAVGLGDAIADTASGDVIWLPAVQISGNFTIPAGVHVIGMSRYASQILGNVTLEPGATLENLTIYVSSSGASTLYGLIGPQGATGTAKASNCDITVANGGAGDAYAVFIDQDGTSLEIWLCACLGESTGGDGYAGYRQPATTASLYFFNGRAEGSTDPFNE